MKQALRFPGVMPLLMSGFIGNIAAWIYAVVMTTYIYDTFGAFMVAMYGLARQIVYLVLSPISGTLIDKFPRKTLLFVINLLSVVSMFSLFLLYHYEVQSIIPVFLIVLVQVFVGTVDYPLRLVLGPKLVENDHLLSLNSISNTTGTIALMVAPGIAGFLLQATGTEFELLMTFVIYGVAMLIVTRMPKFLNVREVSESTTETGSSQNVFVQTVRSWIEGFAFILHNRKVFAANLLLFVNHVVVGALFVFIPSLSTTIGQGSLGIGYLMTANGIGSVLGSLAGGVLAKKYPRMTIVFGSIGLGVACMVCGWFPNLFVAYFTVMLMGFFAMGSEGPILTIIQNSTPDEKAGRVFAAVDTLFIGGMAAGSLIVGVFPASLGFALMLGVIGLVPVIGSLFTVRSLGGKIQKDPVQVTT